jgi:hypothetical protein
MVDTFRLKASFSASQLSLSFKGSGSTLLFLQSNLAKTSVGGELQIGPPSSPRSCLVRLEKWYPECIPLPMHTLRIH